MKSSAIACTNLALIKYWGNRDTSLILPMNSSLSLTLNELFTFTTVEFNNKFKKDLVYLNGKKVKKIERILLVLNKLRKIKGINLNAKIVSKNNFPTGAGLASSASGFAALTFAANNALNLNLSKKELSKIARLGSGSASRSFFGGFVEWVKGTKKNGSDCFAKQLTEKNYWNELRIIACVTSFKEKKIDSRTGMNQTVNSSELYSCWLNSVQKDLSQLKKAIKKKDFSLLGKTAEKNCLKMHSTMFSSSPPLIYWNKGTIELINKVIDLRNSGIECYFTIDAGPQIKIICLNKNVKKIISKLKKLNSVKKFFVCKSGPEIKKTNTHLF